MIRTVFTILRSVRSRKVVVFANTNDGAIYEDVKRCDENHGNGRDWV